MAREKFQTLTEQMFYVLLCLREECCGMDLMERIRLLTSGRVSVGPGTLYNLLEQFAAEVKGVNRILYDVTSKPPATVELE